MDERARRRKRPETGWGVCRGVSILADEEELDLPEGAPRGGA